MVAPLVVAGVAAGLGALVQLYNAEKQRGADKKRLKEIQALFDKIVPPNYDLSIDDPPDLHMEQLQKPEFSDPLQAPKFDQTRLEPKDIKLIGKYIPTIAPYIKEEAPQLIQQSADMERGRAAQMKALDKYGQLAESGRDEAMDAQMAQASRQAQIDAQSRQQSIMQDYARRGLAGSGLGLAAQMQGAASASDRQAMQNLEAAKMAQQNRLAALAAGAQLGGQVRGEDISLQSRNADIINAFNQRMAASQNAWQQGRAGVMNDAERFNLGMAQGVENANIAAQNQMMVRNQNRADEIAKYQSGFAERQQNRQDDNSKWGYNADVNAQNTLNQLLQSQAAWKDKEKQQYNSNLGQQYADQLQKAGLLSGVSMNQMAAQRQATQDQNSAIQGLVNAGVSAYGAHQAGKQSEADRLSADERAQYKETGQWMSPEERAARKKQYEEDYY